uniref:Uncharacterized protein n=1 Tax=Vespula pensylvanica TaxID=30213 RepID=A0A834P6L3_VESPE|nr:hypothetical protein H0235_006428 [Vespula pensylvanica]
MVGAPVVSDRLGVRGKSRQVFNKYGNSLFGWRRDFEKDFEQIEIDLNGERMEKERNEVQGIETFLYHDPAGGGGGGSSDGGGGGGEEGNKEAQPVAPRQ